MQGERGDRIDIREGGGEKRREVDVQYYKLCRFIEATQGIKQRVLARHNGHFLKVLLLRHPYLGKNWRLGVSFQDRLPASIEGSLGFVLDIKDEACLT
jgi:hypothetical protein